MPQPQNAAPGPPPPCPPPPPPPPPTRHQEEEETDKPKQAQTEQTNEKHGWTCGNNLFIYLFLNVINEWNSLSEEVVSSGSINHFKSRLNNFWKDEATKFEPDCYSYPFAHANRYQFNERGQEWAQESRDYTRPGIQ